MNQVYDIYSSLGWRFGGFFVVGLRWNDVGILPLPCLRT